MCLHCEKPFTPRRGGHVFCSVRCRHLGVRGPNDPRPVDQQAVERLFDPSRDPQEQVRADEWFAPEDAAAAVRALYAADTLEQRRRWYERLHDMGRV